MRAILPVLIALLTMGVGGTSHLFAQFDQAPVFKSGVEVMEVDVTVVDGDGNPVRDLRAPEFTVTVDGQPRRVVSAEFISDSDQPGRQPAAPRDPYVSNNTDRRPGRLIMIAIDRNNIDTHTVRGAMAALKQFVSTLAPDDRLSLVTFPPPGPTVDFTTNHAQVLDSLGRIIGMDEPVPGRFNISSYEAVTFENRSDPITTQRLLFRVCGDTDPNTMSNCDRDVEQEAASLASQIRQLTNESVSSLAALLTSLRDVEGAKSLIILSQGLMLDGAQADASHLATLAAEARVNVNVLMFAVTISASQSRMSDTQSQDRDLREAGLESLAGRSRGSLFRVAANPAYVFERVRSELSAYYMLGVEPAERDRDGKQHQIRVEVRRKGVHLRARRQVQYTIRTPNTWSRDVLMGRVLSSPAVNTELPMRLSTYVFRDAAPNKVRVILAAEIDPESMQKELDLAIGFVIIDKVGKVVSSGQERKIYSANSDLPIRYDLTLAVDPGSYRLRIAAIDLAGKRGSVEREVAAFGMSNQEVAMGDLILSSVRPEGRSGDIRPPVVVQVTDGQLGTYTELYTNKPGTLDETSVFFEVADSEDGPALQRSRAELRERPDKTMRQVMAIMPVGALPPGRYIARAVISASDKVVGKLTRPFTITPRAPTPAGVSTGGTGAGAAGDAGGGAGAAGAPSATRGPASANATGILIEVSPASFKREDVLTPEMLRAVFDVIDKNHPAAKPATARARSGKFEGTALMALDAGDQAAGSLLRGLELLMKGQLDPAANQFGVALRNAPDVPLASFYLGVCYAAAGRDKEAVAAWERARAAQLTLPAMQLVLADGWLRLGQASQALEPLRAALERQPDNDNVRKNLAIAQSHLGLHELAYPTIGPYLERHGTDVDALLVALHALYQVHSEGKTLDSAEQDKARAATYARAYAAAKGPHAALVEKWAEFLSR